MGGKEIEGYAAVQRSAKKTLVHLNSFIRAGMTEEGIAAECEHYMRAVHGIPSFWYHNIPALVLVGDRTLLSMSGRDYKPTQAKVQEADLVTVDVSPEIAGYWGDCARSFVVEQGIVIPAANVSVSQLAEGLHAEDMLHRDLVSLVNPRMTFGELHTAMNRRIQSLGYLNLDFKGNLGHSIECCLEDRTYIEEGNKRKLGEVQLFTFEPHIKKQGGIYGFKREDIYYFAAGRLQLL